MPLIGQYSFSTSSVTFWQKNYVIYEIKSADLYITQMLTTPFLAYSHSVQFDQQYA